MEGESTTWLELPPGGPIALESTCSIGRASSNQLVLADAKVSRHHAVIRVAEPGEWWVIDLASANGTYVNGRRAHAQRLQDGDAIAIGSRLVTFRSRDAGARAGRDAAPLDDTAQDVREVPAWLLLADIEDSTGISRREGPLEMERAFGVWLARCNAILADTGGILDKPLGDGFFAFWPAVERTPRDMARALLAFREFQAVSPLPFRMAWHAGMAFTGGEMASGIYRLFGREVHFTFRMEGLAKALGIDCILSDAAQQALREHLKLQPAGAHAMPGVEGASPFFRL